MSSLADMLEQSGALEPHETRREDGRRLDDRELLARLAASPQRHPAAVARAVASHARLAYVDLADARLDPSVVALVPAEICRKYTLIPLTRDDDRLTVAIADPSNVLAIDDVAALTRLRVRPVIGERGEILALIARHHRAEAELSSLSLEVAGQAPASTPRVDAPGAREEADAAPIVRFVNLLIAQAIHDRASDIHIEPGESELRVRYRIDGVLKEMPAAPLALRDGVVSRLKIMGDLDIAERRRPQDGRMSVEQGGRRIDLRVATLPTVRGEKVVLRVLDAPYASRTLEDLGMSAENLRRYARAARRPHGGILITGPTGSGKSSTLYTTLGQLRRPEVNIVTIEDPVEHRMDGVAQMQINTRAGVTFATALRSILRADPDIVMVGEIRDRETAQIAIEASLTGHLVLSTLHTNDAASALTRLVEMGVEPYLVGSSLQCIVAQRLARRLCERCRIEHYLNAEGARAVGFPIDLRGPRVWVPGSCSACSGTGYLGRVAIHEVLEVDDRIASLVQSGATSAHLAAAAEQGGMTRLRADGWSKVAQGLTSIDEVLRVTA